MALSDEAAELSGSLGLGGAVDTGDGVCVAQAQHGSAPDIAGTNVANPVSLILSAAMLLDWIGRRDASRRARDAAAVQHAVDTVLDDPGWRTRDIGGHQDTDQFAAHVADVLRADAGDRTGTTGRITT